MPNSDRAPPPTMPGVGASASSRLDSAMVSSGTSDTTKPILVAEVVSAAK